MSETGAWEPDPWVWDDQSVIVDVRGLGLVVLSSCSHAGAVNVLRNALQVTTQPKVHAFIGGLHLSGPLFEPIIPDTIGALAAIAPDVVVPGHCTGWRATHELAAPCPGPTCKVASARPCTSPLLDAAVCRGVTGVCHGTGTWTWTWM